MDLQSIKFEQWTIETAQMKHTARKSSMSSVAQTYLRKKAAEIGITDHQAFMVALSESPDIYEAITDEEREFCDVATSAGSWAGLCGCIKPYISLDEWLSFDDKTIEGLGLAVQELNPHWLAMPDQEVPPVPLVLIPFIKKCDFILP